MCEFVDGETQNGTMCMFCGDTRECLYMWRDRGYVCVETGVCLNGEMCVYMCVKKTWEYGGRDKACGGEKRVLVCVGVCVWRVECVGALEEEKWVCVCEGNVELECVCGGGDWGMDVRERQGYRGEMCTCVRIRMERHGCMGVEKTLYMSREVE